ncbi:MAG: nucleoside-diphosphate sugar epimerase/dehydratase [Actinomycetota bacterium]|nr:nucleoside-diphosphate sugar epimerase/dehydratase [Actinomycetota bacterium]MDP3630596.1 nucleoside-diphosphate sugar epimerase/dehydratase [Actinomycetota bacterium]
MTPLPDTGASHIRYSRYPIWLPKVVYVAVDTLIIIASTLLAYWARFDGPAFPEFRGNIGIVSAVAVLVFVTGFVLAGLYRHVWRYAGASTYIRLFLSVAAGTAILALMDLTIPTPGGGRYAPLGVLALLAVFELMGATVVRAYDRVSAYLHEIVAAPREASRILVVGAGDAGSIMLRDIAAHPEYGLKVTGFLDDNPNKAGRVLRGVPVFGPIERLPEIAKRLNADEIYVAMPSGEASQQRRVLDICAASGLPTQIAPSLSQFSGEFNTRVFRHVAAEDLLGRDAVVLDRERIAHTITDKVVLITGAAGSIGSELARQVLRFGPRRLVLLDVDESRLYETYLELRGDKPSRPVMAICNIRNTGKLQSVFAEHRPNLVFHAAAYKHVPLMEIAPDEAVLTNVLGTLNVLKACEQYEPERVVLISTDKAVEPTSVMGVTKAVSERLAFAACRKGVPVCVVRFGNVLGSRGSVVPIFEARLRNREPLQVTHPDMTRYFMTISEASLLVLQAQALDAEGHLFVLDMGTPVKIVDLASKMISLSGVRVPIEFIGLRPAEKMHEMLTTHAEKLLPTTADKIMAVNVIPLDAEAPLSALIDSLIKAGDERSSGEIRRLLESIVPDYRPH